MLQFATSNKTLKHKRQQKELKFTFEFTSCVFVLLKGLSHKMEGVCCHKYLESSDICQGSDIAVHSSHK